jgi:hypothetical protein
LTERRVFLEGLTPFVWSGVQYEGDYGYSDGGINARWYNSDNALIAERFAQVAAKCVVHPFDQMTGSGNLTYHFEYVEWVARTSY